MRKLLFSVVTIALLAGVGAAQAHTWERPHYYWWTIFPPYHHWYCMESTRRREFIRWLPNYYCRGYDG